MIIEKRVTKLYNGNGDVIYKKVEGENILTTETKYEYQGKGKLSHVFYGDGKESIYVRTKAKHLEDTVKSMTTIAMTNVVFTRNLRKYLRKMGTETTIVYKNGTKEVIMRDSDMTLHSKITYNKKGLMVEKILDDGRDHFVFKYDKFGNMIESRNLMSKGDPDTFEYDYTSYGKISRVYKNGVPYMTYKYNSRRKLSFELNEITKLERLFQYNKRGDIAWIRSSDLEESPEITYEYNKDRSLRLVKTMYKNSTTYTEYSYDAKGRLLMTTETTTDEK